LKACQYVLDRGLNDRIRTVAARYGARVVDLLGVALFANQLVSSDCVHPNGAGYQVILNLFQTALL
jgi:lysophospholipase L1-like esterase